MSETTYPPQPTGPSETLDWTPQQPAPAPTARPEQPWRRRAGAAVAVVALSLGSGAAGAALVDRDDSGTAGNPAGEPATVQTADSTDGAAPLAEVAAAVQPSVVSIAIQGPQGSGEGSGVVLRADGMILTNNHVAEGAANGGSLTVTFSDGTTADAELIGTDPATDLAVIQVEGVTDLTPATFAAEDDLVVGETVLAIGSPLGLQGSVTAGIVSALHRTVELGTAQDGTPSILSDAIQTDAPINPGNSGGALVDTEGHVVGINTAIASLGAGSGSGNIGLGFAIPVGEAMSVAEALMDGRQPAHPVLGVSVRSTPEGALVAAVVPGSAADAAGIEPGDLITAIDGQEVGAADSLPTLIRGFDPGDVVPVTFLRADQERTVEVTIGSSES